MPPSQGLWACGKVAPTNDAGCEFSGYSLPDGGEEVSDRIRDLTRMAMEVSPNLWVCEATAEK